MSSVSQITGDGDFVLFNWKIQFPTFRVACLHIVPNQEDSPDFTSTSPLTFNLTTKETAAGVSAVAEC